MADISTPSVPSARAAQRRGFRHLPALLRVYLTCVVAAALLLGVALAPGLPAQGADLPLALLVLALLALARRYEIHLAPKLKVSTDTAVMFAAALLFHPSLVLLVSAVGNLLANAVARRPWYNLLFSAAQAGLSGTIGALVYMALASNRLDQAAEALDQLPALGLAALSMYGTNALLVDIAISLQLGQRMMVGWWQRHRGDLPHHLALFLLGTLPAITARSNPWTLALVAVPTAVVYISLRDLVRLRVQTREAVEALADMVDLRDPYTHGHSQRVAVYAGLVARRLGLSPEETETVRAAARVHDIGKIAVPDRVLLKPGRLDEAEFRVMQQHQEVGAQLLERFPDFHAGQQYVLSHHERPDGRGYARGLRGSAIPLGAAIIAVADSFDAMTSDRPYRAALTVEAALEELRCHRGRQWEARAVDALLDVLDEGSPGPALARLAAAGA